MRNRIWWFNATKRERVTTALGVTAVVAVIVVTAFLPNGIGWWVLRILAYGGTLLSLLLFKHRGKPRNRSEKERRRKQQRYEEFFHLLGVWIVGAAALAVGLYFLVLVARSQFGDAEKLEPSTWFFGLMFLVLGCGDLALGTVAWKKGYGR